MSLVVVRLELFLHVIFSQSYSYACYAYYACLLFVHLSVCDDVLCIVALGVCVRG